MNTSKWADNVITGVRHDPVKGFQRITAVQARIDNGDSLGVPVVMSKQQVVNAIRLQRLTFVTAIFVEGTWRRGEDVRVFTRNGVDYIRTDANNIEADNLGELPEF